MDFDVAAEVLAFQKLVGLPLYLCKYFESMPNGEQESCSDIAESIANSVNNVIRVINAANEVGPTSKRERNEILNIRNLRNG